ncbi:glycosyltransferase [Agromyces agglutinans]|nr:glycosyltransferase [Agromyces agglutinans]
MHTLQAPDGTTRYVDHMIGAAPPGVRIMTFTWGRAIFGRYDVLHVHWPESLVRHPRLAGRAAKRMLLEMLLARLRLTRTPIVRTIHNVAPHEPGDSAEARVLGRIDRRTDFWILLQPGTPSPNEARSMVIRHGHYRGVFQSEVAAVRGRMLQFGLLRPYKGVEALIAAFAELDDPRGQLRIVGRPHSADFEAALRRRAERDRRVSLRLEFVPDAALIDEIRQAELVVLPYTEMHNSGAVLVALSLDRPVLVPRSSSTDSLAEEVGESWVLRYDGPLDAKTLAAARVAAASHRPGRPDLSGRDWARVGELHGEVYRLALVPDQPNRAAINRDARA